MSNDARITGSERIPECKLAIPVGAETWGRKPSWRAIVLSVVSTLVFVAAFNLLVDPFGLYKTGLFRPITQINTYQYKQFLFKNFRPQARALVLGSSQTGMSIDPEDVTALTGYRCFSFTTQGATTEILYATMRLVLEQLNASIEVVVVGTEFMAYVPEFRPIHPMAKTRYEYSRYFTDDPVWPSVYEKYSRLWSVEQITHAFRSVGRVIQGKEMGRWQTWEANGAYRLDWGKQRGGDSASRIKKGIANRSRLMTGGRFPGFSDERKKYWEMFLEFCQDNDIEVFVFLSPEHPDMLREFKRVGVEPIFQGLNKYLESTVTSVGGTFRDCRDITVFGGDAQHFRDAIHQTMGNSRPLLEYLLSDFNPVEVEDGN